MDVRDEISRDKRKSKVESSAAGESVKKTSGRKKSFVKAKGKGKANPSVKPKPPVIPNPPVKLKEHLAKVKLAKETKPNAPSKPKVLVKPNQTKSNQTKPKVSVEEGSDEDGEEKGSESEEDGEKEVSDDGEDGGSESEEDGEEEREEEGSDDGEDGGSEEDEEYEGSEDEVEDGEDEGDGEESDEDEGVDNRSLVLFKGKCRNVSGSKKRKQFSDEKSGLKHKKNVSKDKKMKHVFEEKKVSKQKKKHESSSSSSEDEKPMKKKESLSKPKSESSSKSKKEKRKDSKKKMKKPLTEEEKKRLAYLNKFKPMKSRTVPKTLFATIRDSRVDMESFLSGIGFSSLYNISMDTMPSRLARFVVSSFDSTSYEFKLAKGKFVVTSKKVHEILGIPLGGKSLFDLPERSPDDPFMKKWFDQFGNRKLKEIEGDSSHG